MEITLGLGFEFGSGFGVGLRHLGRGSVGRASLWATTRVGSASMAAAICTFGWGAPWSAVPLTSALAVLVRTAWLGSVVSGKGQGQG